MKESETSLKKTLLLHCATLLEKKEQVLLQAMKDASDFGTDAEKSSAGDKHETARAMAHLEQEKLSQQFKDLQKQKEMLSRITVERSDAREGPGTLYVTDAGNYFIAIAGGRIVLNDQNYYLISSSSPAAVAFLKRNGSSVQIGANKVTVLEVY